MNVVITGITGFAGSHLAEYLVRKGHQVRGLGAAQDSLTHLETLISEGYLQVNDIFLADLEDRAAIRHLLNPIPDFLYHLAAQASVPRSWENPRETFRINVLGTLTLLECLRELRPCPRMLYVSSADVYGASADADAVITEEFPMHPLNPYSLSKASADSLCQQTFLRDGLPIIRVRPFNHIGPRQSLGFAAADFANQIARGEIDVDYQQIHVGRLDAVRDFTDVRDMVKAYELAIIFGEPGAVYNICSSVGRSLQELLDGLLALSPIDFEVIQDESLMRPTEIPYCVGSNRLFTELTGWSPQIPWSQTLKDILEDHRQRIAFKTSIDK
jgi:GDP-4-dehydro-6-deoxy-D-mannose reductase